MTVRPQTNETIRIIGPLPVLAAAVLFSLLVGHWLFQALRDSVKLDAQRNISAIGEIKASQLHDWLDDRMSDAATLSVDSYFSRATVQWFRHGAPDNAQRKQIVGRMEAFLHEHHYRAIVLYDEAGKVVLSAGERFPDVAAIGAAIRETHGVQHFQFVDLHRHQDARKSVGLGFLTPLRAGADYAGTLYLVEDPALHLFPMLDDEPMRGGSVETQLVRQENDRVVYLDQLRHHDEPPLGFSQPLNSAGLAAALAVRGKTGLIDHAIDDEGKRVLAYAIAIAGTPWVLLAKIDEHEAYHLVNELRNVTVILAVFLIVLTMAWGWQWYRRLRAATDAEVLQERLRADTLQLEAEQRFRAIFEHAALPIARNALDGTFLEVNDAWCAMFGYTREDVAGTRLSWQQVTHPDDMEPGAGMVKKMLAGEFDSFKLDRRYIHKDGRILWGAQQTSLVRNKAGAPQCIINAIQDITEQKQSEQQISFMAYHDRLTGLPNRALFFDRFSQAISQARRSRKQVALMYLDMDGFKPINDTHGHEAGDAVLRMAAQRLLACVRATDTVARLGGDEFAIIVGQLESTQEIERIAQQILGAFAQAMVLPNGCECVVGTSIGISFFPEHGSEMDSLLAAADAAMYDSKHKGKNTYTCYGGPKAGDTESWLVFDDGYLLGVAEMDEQHRELVRLVNRLNEAVKRKAGEAVVLRLYEELLEFTSFHFASEHRLMERYGYPAARQHDDEHNHLVAQAVQFKVRLGEGGDLLALQSIKDWLVNHILYADKPMAAYLREKGVQ